ncbi:MAG TPA: DUF6786 family protein [Pirellulales bacterium]|nr:DUF6786 family protein [Pirellulales bacterium]
MRSPLSLVLRAVVCASAVVSSDARIPAEDSYGDDRDFLARHTRVIELVDGDTRVAICPKYQGRVMTSTCQGQDGPSFGWINREFIDADKPSDTFNNYGGEDRFWLGPEGGQFALWFAPGEEQILPHWRTPPGLNGGGMSVDGKKKSAMMCRMTRSAKFTNASKTLFLVDVTRTVRLVDRDDLSDEDGKLVTDDLKFVGFETENVVTNRGETWDEETGLLAIWILGMFPGGDGATIIVPYIPGPDESLGPVVFDDYFARPPEDRLRVTPQAILFRGDGKFRSKIGTSQRRARPWAGSMDFGSGVLTLVNFTMPSDPTKARYVNNNWKLPQDEPYTGDVFNSYNDGPAEPGAKSLGGFYELETMSPTKELAHGKSIKHTHRTFHLTGSQESLDRVATAILGVDLDDVRKAMSQ